MKNLFKNYNQSKTGVNTNGLLNRKEALLTGAGGLLALGLPMACVSGQDRIKNAKHARIINTALDCVKAGEVCLDHCLTELAKGNKMLGECAKRVEDTIPMCEALAKLAAQDSRHLKALANVCIAVCEDCEKECLKHAKHHAECKACAESCRDCINACKKVA